MRRRLTVSILVLIAVTLVVTTIGSYFFIRRAAVSTTQQELAGQAQAISTTFTSGDVNKKTLNRELHVIAKAGAFAGVGFIRLEPGGTYQGAMPAGITIGELDVPALQAGHQVTGHTGSLLAYSAVPTPIAGIGFVPILVITRQIHNPANGLRYFLLVGVVALAVAALVAAALARRFTKPLVAAVATTRRIASGDLDATMAVGRREDPEFAQLAESINAMGANLVRARDQERQFLLSVSHELRTPLTSIRGYADAVIDGTADDPVAAAAVISTESRRLERLVQDLLDLARLDADRFSLELQRVDAAAVAGQVVESFRPRAEELGLELETAPGSDMPLWVEADADRLAQVLANLVENASSFAAPDHHRRCRQHRGHAHPLGGGRRTGHPPRPAPPGLRAPCHLADRAGGRRKGSGLGLAIVSELSAAMGAGVRAESPVAAGGGTRMLVWFRSAPVPPPSPPVSDRPAETPGRAGPGPTGGVAGPPVASVAPSPPATPVPPIPGGGDG